MELTWNNEENPILWEGTELHVEGDYGNRIGSCIRIDIEINPPLPHQEVCVCLTLEEAEAVAQRLVEIVKFMRNLHGHK